MNDAKDAVFFHDEVMLAGWRDSHTAGPMITLRLRSSELLEPFRGMTVAKDGKAGQRIALVMVMIDDDEKPLPVKNKLGPLALLSVTWCKSAQFQNWMGGPAGKLTEAQCREMILKTCKVDSRKKLDTDPGAAATFDTLIRRPYMKFMKENDGG